MPTSTRLLLPATAVLAFASCEPLRQDPIYGSPPERVDYDAVLRFVEELAPDDPAVCPPYLYEGPEAHALLLDPRAAIDALPAPILPLNVRWRHPDADRAPEGFFCFGACGPSCQATLAREETQTRVYRRVASDGGVRHAACEYRIRWYWSSAICRSHDDCYRQADNVFYADPANAGRRLGSTDPLYNACQIPVAAHEAEWTVARTIIESTPQGAVVNELKARLGYDSSSECWPYYASGSIIKGCGDRTLGYSLLAGAEELTPEAVAARGEPVIDLPEDL